MSTPGIKGTTFQKVAEDLLELVEAGRLDREELEARLSPQDLRLLEEKVSPTAWIPIESYERMVELLASIEAPMHREAYLVRRGEEAAERLASLGIYSQLDATTAHMGTRIGHMIVTLARAIFNFGEWRYEPRGEDGGFEIRVEDAMALPEVGRLAVQGFTQVVATRASGLPTRVESQRIGPGRFLFRATRSA